MEPTIGFVPPKRNPSTSGTVNQYMKRNFTMFGSGGATNPNAGALAALRNARSQFKGGGKEWQAIQDQIMGIRNQRKINQVAPKPTPQTQPRPTQPVAQKPATQPLPQPVQTQPAPQTTPPPVQTQPAPTSQPNTNVNPGTGPVNTGTPPVNTGSNTGTGTTPETTTTPANTGWNWDFDWSKYTNGSNGQDYPQYGNGYQDPYDPTGYNSYDPYGWESGGYGVYGQDPYGSYYDPYNDPYGQYGGGYSDPYGYDPYSGMYGSYGQDPYGDMYGDYYGNYDSYGTSQDPQQSPSNGNMNTGTESTGNPSNTGTSGNGTGQPEAIPSDQMPKPYWLQQVESNGRFSPWHDFAGQAPFATKSQWAGMDPSEQQGYLGMIPKYLQNDYLENMQKAWIPGVQRSRAFLQ